jgi:hypothetical protein
MAITREKSTGGITPATVSINRERRERKGEMMELTGGSHLSFVEEKERVPFRDFGRVGRGPLPELG